MFYRSFTLLCEKTSGFTINMAYKAIVHWGQLWISSRSFSCFKVVIPCVFLCVCAPCWEFYPLLVLIEGFSGGGGSEEPTCQCRRCKRQGFGPWVRKIPGGGPGSPLQCSCLENSMDRGAWQATHWVTKSQRRLKQLCTAQTALISSVQSLSRAWLFATPWTTAHQASLSISSSQSLLKLMSIELVTPSNHLILCCPFSSCPQSFPASGSFPSSQFFASGGQSIGASASASVLPMNIQDWFPLG